MRSVMLRMVTEGVLRSVMPAFVIDQTPELIVLHVPAGSAGYTRTGVHGGPRGRLLVPGTWEDGFVSRPWMGRDVVMVHRFAESWSTWRWIMPDGGWQPGSYINLERPWRIAGDVFDTEDLMLDIVIDDAGRVEFKDEDELGWAEEVGWYSTEFAAQIRVIGQQAYRHCSAEGWPLDTSWNTWLPQPGQGLPRLPNNWKVQPPLE